MSNNDRIYSYQLREFVESLGGTVVWNQSSDTITISFGDVSFNITPNEDYWVNENHYWTTDAVIYATLGIERPTEWGSEFAGILFAKNNSYGVWYAEVDAAQAIFGYNGMYDIGFKLFSDYTRFISTFNAEDAEGTLMEWRIEGWKGNYMNMGVGGEIGIYYHYADRIPTLTHKVVTIIQDVEELENGSRYFENVYCPGFHYWVVSSEDMMRMSFKLYWGAARPENLIMIRPEVLHWWVTGFRPGLEIPSEELTMVGSITFPNSTMANAFAKNVVSFPTSRGGAPGKFTKTINGTRVDFTWGPEIEKAQSKNS